MIKYYNDIYFRNKKQKLQKQISQDSEENIHKQKTECIHYTEHILAQDYYKYIFWENLKNMQFHTFQSWNDFCESADLDKYAKDSSEYYTS